MEQHQRIRRTHLFETALPWLVLLILLFLTLSVFEFFPYAGFEITYDEVVSVFTPSASGEGLQVGDRIIQVGSLPWDDYYTHRWRPVFGSIKPGEMVPIRVERDGLLVDIAWIYPGVTSAQLFENLMGFWWLGFVFWLAGTCTLLFIRPRDTIWKLLIAFNYLTAVWLLAGSGPSRWHILGGAIILRVAAWMFAPVSLQLNWLFPRPLARVPSYVWWLLYFLAGVLAVLELFSLPPESAYMIGLAIGGIGIILLQLAHVIFQPAYRKYITPLAVGAVIAVTPPLLVLLRDLFDLPTSPTAPGVTADLASSLFIYSASVLGIAALPGIYFYSVYMLQFGGPNRRVQRLVRIYLLFILVSALLVLFFAFFFIWTPVGLSNSAINLLLFGMAVLISAIGLFPLLALPALQASVAGGVAGDHPQLRANRLVSLYLFFVLMLAIVGVLAFLLYNRERSLVPAGLFILISSLLSAVFSILAYPRFQKFVDRRILGIPLPPTHLLETYSSRITTSLEPASLVSLLRDELLPSLLVRQSALYQLFDGHLHLLYAVGIKDDQLLSDQDLPELMQAVNTLPPGLVPPVACLYAWPRVILPLQVERQLVGVWLLGKRDPDDSYEAGELAVLQSVANQTAIALVNIHQSERLHALYQADIEREEAERAELALFLHDEVLNPLAALSMQVEPEAASPKFEQGVQALISNLREAVGGLRPAMLNYGLYSALVELTDELNERAGHSLQVKLEMEPTAVRYEAKAEQHLYRIVEQACENALRHARCRHLVVQGELKTGQVELSVIDDGVGLPEGFSLNLNQLLVEGHYGLVGMYERAALIGAEIRIASSPGAGTHLSLFWKPERPPAPYGFP